MKNLYILIAILVIFSINDIKSQTFDFIISPSSQTIIAGQTAEFEIDINASNDLFGTIIFNSDYKNVKYLKNYINPPYNSFKFQITPSILDSGLKIISIRGQSGSITYNSLCTLDIVKNPIAEQIVEIVVPHSISRYSDKFIKDIDNNLTILYTNTSQSYANLYTYKDKVWNKEKLDIGLYFSDDILITDFHFYQIHNDSLWLNHKSGLILSHKNQVNIFNNNNSEIGDGIIKCIYLDHDGNPFVVRNVNNKYYFSYFRNGNWERFNDLNFEIKDKSTGYDVYMKSLISFDNDNNVYFLNKSNQINKISFDNNIPQIEIKSYPNVELTYINSDKNGVLYFVDNKNFKVHVLENNIITTIDFPIGIKNIETLSIINSFNFWFKSENGLYNYLNNQFEFYSFKDFPVDNYQQLSNITLDKNNNVWVETKQAGRFIVFNPSGLVGVPIISSLENEVVANPDILIFPNPSSDMISIDLCGVEVADLVVYDILSNEIMTIPNYTNKSEIDISNLSIGTYTIQIQTSTGSISQRLLVNR